MFFDNENNWYLQVWNNYVFDFFCYVTVVKLSLRYEFIGIFSSE